MKKVFCKNCTYSSSLRYNICEVEHHAPRKFDYREMSQEESARDRQQIANIEGECPDYKRKWWKFWINGD